MKRKSFKNIKSSKNKSSLTTMADSYGIDISHHVEASVISRVLSMCSLCALFCVLGYSPLTRSSTSTSKTNDTNRLPTRTRTESTTNSANGRLETDREP